MTWTTLDRPLLPDDPRRVPREAAGARVAAWLPRGLGPFLLVGPPRCGRSTELMAVAEALPADLRPVLVRLERFRSARDLAPELLLYGVAQLVVDEWVASDAVIGPTPSLIADLRASDPFFPQGNGRRVSPLELAITALTEARPAYEARRLVLLVDGIERMAAPAGFAALEALRELAGHADLVVVAGPALAHGPAAAEALRRWRVIDVGPVPDSQASFLEELVRRREPSWDALDPAVRLGAAQASAGVAGVLLGLLADAARFGDGAPDPTTFGLARDDLRDRLRRLLEAGDREALLAVEGSAGDAIPAERRVRLLEHGLLQELPGPVMRVHPLLRGFLGLGAPSVAGEGAAEKPASAVRKRAKGARG